MANHSQVSQLLDWYQSVHARRVDLVGDYAGSELFVVELDSLLLHSFSDELLDFKDGLQLLQAVHSVELFLHQLQRRKCNFALVAFNNHASLCVPYDTADDQRYKYNLARTVIIQHLQLNSTVSVSVFESRHDPAFLAHLRAVGAYFVMAHDGSHPKPVDASGNPTASEKMQRFSFRQAILAYMSAGHAVALINGLEFRDTKVRAQLLLL